MRDSVEYFNIPAPGLRRITFLGDSFTYGHGVREIGDRFANRIRGMLDGVEVHCFAEGGWDTGTHLEKVENFIRNGYRLDKVVLVYVLNDVGDIVPAKVAMDARFAEAYRPGYLTGHSYLFNTLYFRLVIARDNDFRHYDHLVIDGYEGEIWEAQKRRLERLRDLVASAGGELLVVTFPYVHQSGADSPFESIYPKLEEFWTALGVRHIDLRPAFAPYRSRELVAGRLDVHPNKEAHAIAADAILPFLVEALNPRS